jgi:phosphatidylethanolamine-binding protein (PEBP) family uncharacterized protein
MHNRRSVLLAVIIIVGVLAGGCTSSAPSSPVSPALSQPAEKQALSPTPPGAFTIRAASLAPGSVLPDVYTCKGASESPEVAWDGVPPGTKSLALILDDPDAKVLANGAQQGETSTGSRGYYPPCPPIGTTHRYVFRLYAVDMDITQPTADRESIDWALTGHTIAQTEFTTTFKR